MSGEFNLADVFNGVDKGWVKMLTSPSMMVPLSRAFSALALEDHSAITPPINEVFNFARFTPYDGVRVIIVGQDPYSQRGDAHGLAFSSRSAKVPASLRNIYACLLAQGIIKEVPTTSGLEYWARQGVLLLNAALTTRIGVTNAHAKIWSGITSSIISSITRERAGIQQPIVFLWGVAAQRLARFVSPGARVLVWGHPSPLAQASSAPAEKFVACDHFATANTYLAPAARIDWEVTPRNIVFTDGACSKNGAGILARAGYAAYFAEGPLARGVGYAVYGRVAEAVVAGVTIYGTSQRGEGLGIICALEEMVAGGWKASGVNILVTDSKFWKQMIEDYMPNWEKKGLDFMNKKNGDLTTRMYAAVKTLEGRLTIVHVASHGKDASAPASHVRGNGIADTYAVMGREMAVVEVVKVVGVA